MSACSDAVDTEEVKTCGICLDLVEDKDRHVTECKHVFCAACMKQWSDKCKEEAQDTTCPVCRHTLSSRIRCIAIHLPHERSFTDVMFLNTILHHLNEQVGGAIVVPPYGVMMEQHHFDMTPNVAAELEAHYGLRISLRQVPDQPDLLYAKTSPTIMSASQRDVRLAAIQTLLGQ